MKSAMPFYGVSVPECRRIARALCKAHPFQSASEWRAAIIDIWKNAKRREERYAAIELLTLKRHEPWLTPASIELIETLVVDGAWWDYVDGIAAHAMGRVLANHPAATKPVLRAWAADDNMWKRRTAILAQLTLKSNTDERLLYECLEPSIPSSEFFLRKAIGWALRDYSKTNPESVIDFVERNAHRLSPLSKREGLKAVLKRGLISAIP